MYPLVSILVPVYGVDKFIAKCARSLLDQTYENIEYVFVDDCSPDDSINVLKKVLLDYPHRVGSVKIVSHKVNLGLSGARNTALLNASGEYVTFVDSDDYLDLDAIEKLVALAKKDGSDIIVSNLRYIYGDKHENIKFNIAREPRLYIRQLLTYEIPVCVCARLYRRKLFVDSHIKFIEGLNFGEDYVTSPRIAYFANKISYCREVYYNYVQDNSQSYSNNYRSKNIDDLIWATKILQTFFENTINYYEYKDVLGVVCLMNKVKLISAVCLHYHQVGDRIHEVCGLYEEDYGYARELPIKYQLILLLAKYKLVTLLRWYIRGGITIKRLVKG